MPFKDPAARRKYHQKYMKERYTNDVGFRKAHQRRMRSVNSRRRERAREVVLEFKKDGCHLCGEKEPCCLSAHHLRDKKFTIGVSRVSVSLDILKKELKKCICLCENCHRKIHAGVLTLRSQAAKAAVS